MTSTKHKVADESRLSEDGSRVIIEIGGQEIAVFRIDGEYHALANYCVHQAGPLCEGPTERPLEIEDGEWIWQEGDDEVVKCPWHRWRFEIATGENVDNPKYKVPTYDITVEDSTIYVVK